MADEETLARLKQGVRAWNQWREEREEDRQAILRVDLIHANLSGANLFNANLSGANLTDAILIHACLSRANLFNTDLSGANLTDAIVSHANLRGATLAGANLTGADLRGADLRDASLSRANLFNAYLSGANLTGAILHETVLGNVNLSRTSGLDRCNHIGPSIVDHRTLLQSGSSLPLQFLRGCGLPDRLIDYLPSLLQAGSIQFYSCFISYSSANQDFATRLHESLQSNGVRCWFAPEDMLGGKKVHDQIDEAIRVYDRLLLILSHESMASRWVKTEIAKARRKQATLQRNVLFPIRLVPFDDIRLWEQFDADQGDDAAREIREFHLPDFSNWKNHDAYQQSFEKLLKALKSAE